MDRRRQNLDAHWKICDEFKIAVIAGSLPMEGKVEVGVYRAPDGTFTPWFSYAGVPVMRAENVELLTDHYLAIDLPVLHLNQLLHEDGEVKIID